MKHAKRLISDEKTGMSGFAIVRPSMGCPASAVKLTLARLRAGAR